MKNIIKNENGIVFQNLFFNLETGETLSPIKTSNYEIVQVADSYFVKNRTCEEHKQMCDIEITFSVYNEVLCKTDGYGETVEKSDVYLNFRNDRHCLQSKNRSRYQTVALNAASEEARQLIFQIYEKHKNKEKRKIRLPKIADNMTAIVSELINEEKAFSEMLLDSIVTSVLVSILRYDTENQKSEQPFSKDELLPDILNYVDSNFLTIKTIDEIAVNLGYSHSHLCRIFKERHGSTISEYLHEKQLSYAAEKLLEGMRISDIFEAIGYTNTANFSRAFKKRFGISPGEYKKLYTKD
jgi:AraC-like DNA-binding protein